MFRFLACKLLFKPIFKCPEYEDKSAAGRSEKGGFLRVWKGPVLRHLQTSLSRAAAKSLSSLPDAMRYPPGAAGASLPRCQRIAHRRGVASSAGDRMFPNLPAAPACVPLTRWVPFIDGRPVSACSPGASGPGQKILCLNLIHACSGSWKLACFRSFHDLCPPRDKNRRRM